MKINSSDLFSVVYITERYNCQYPETILSIIRCMIHNFWTREESNDITITIHPYGQTVCFSVKPARKIFIYTISVKQNSKSVFIIRDFLVQLFWSDISVSCLSFTDCIDTESLFVVFLCLFVCFFAPVVDFKLVFVFVVGIFLFFYAKTLSR